MVRLLKPHETRDRAETGSFVTFHGGQVQDSRPLDLRSILFALNLFMHLSIVYCIPSKINP